MVTFTNPTGGAAAWKLTHVLGTNLVVGVSCPSVALCVAVDYGGNVVTSRNPTGGAAASKVAHVGVSELWGVSCASTSLCVAVDNVGYVAASSNPTGGATAWKPTQVVSSSGFRGVSCIGDNLCVAVGDAGNVFTSSDPTGGRRPGQLPTWSGPTSCQACPVLASPYASPWIAAARWPSEPVRPSSFTATIHNEPERRMATA
jgi:hypothetical protein